MSKEKFEPIVRLKPVKQEALLTVIVPIHNEANCITIFHNRLELALEKVPVRRVEIIYINDGSTDNTLELLLEIASLNPCVQIVDFSRNFGKEAAITAGLNESRGDAVVLIDADLQDPPECIPEMVKQWQSGYDIVNMCRTTRAGETFFKKKTAQAFYMLIGKTGPVKMPENVGDFRLISRSAVEALQQMPERNRFMKGMFAWIGYPVKEIFYQRDARYAGKSKWNYWGLWNLAVDGITSYTTAPLKVSAYLGLFTSIATFLYGIFVVVKTTLYGDPVPGYPSLIVIILFLGGLQLLAIGVVGEYLGRIFLETKNRPLYLVKTHYKRNSSHIVTPKVIQKRNV